LVQYTNLSTLHSSLIRGSSLGVSTPKPTASEVEDGEVDDAKISSAFAKAEPPTTEVTHPKPASPTRTTVEPQKSDILLKREQHLRERDAKNASASAAGRPELPRNTSSSLMDRNNHALPNRPDAPFPSHRMLDRDRHSSSRYGDRRDGRDARLPDINRLDRPGDKARDFAGNERRDPDPNRDFGRPLDRPRTRPDRPEPPPRWTPDSARENQERAANGGRLSRDVMPPPRPSGPADRGPLPNERISSLNPDRPELINPEGGAINPARAALITGASTPPYSGSPRHFREEPRNARDRISSRPQSPRRHTSDRDHIDSRRDERTNHMDDILPPPVGPRNDRSIDRNHERGSVDRSRDSSAFQSTLPPPRLMDPDHGRLNSNRQQADPNFGRLNSSPNSDVPLGPRDRNERPQRGGRMGNGSQPRRDGRLTTDPPRPPTPEKVVPTGPSANRPPRRSASGQFDVPTHTPGTGHTTPLDASPAHQGSWNFGPAAQQPPPLPTQQASIPPPGVHPDRLRGFMDDSSPSLPPSQLNNSQSRQPFPSIVTAVAPAGPKGALSSPSSAGPNGMAPPTGPASAVERARGGRRQLAGINTMLQQAGQQNAPDRMNVRGRGRLSSAAQAETPLSQPATPTIPPPPPPALGPPPTNYDNGTSDRVDLITGGPPDEERGQERNGRRDRSGRHTHRPSRSPQGSDRNRDAKHGPDDERSGREHRERREGGRPEPSDRDRHQNREQGRDLMASVRDRERDSRRDGRERDGGREMHEAGWTGERGGRSRDMRGGEERRDSRNPRGEDGGRKRRPEEGGMDRGHEKRPRR
jgi:THO complex subunit 2